MSFDISEVSSFSRMYTFQNNDWSDVEFVTRASDGVRGAWFYTNTRKGSVVVKSQNDSQKQVMGNVFLRSMGINAPDSRLVKRTSAEGEQIAALGECQGLNAKNPTHYIIMDRVVGPSYSNLLPSNENIEMVDRNLEAIGELAVYDLILGNNDRLPINGQSFNSGNIMFQEGVLHAIDTDCQPDEEDQGEMLTKRIFTKIINGDPTYGEKLARMLANHLGAGGVDENTFSSEKINRGIHKAFKRVEEFFKAYEERKRIFVIHCQQRGCELDEFPNYVERKLNYIYTQLNKSKV